MMRGTETRLNEQGMAPIRVINPLFVYYHTHWDREWYLPFREYQHRLLKVVDRILDAVEGGELCCFTLDGQTVLLEDYLEFRPQHRERIKALVGRDKLSIGPWYVMPDSFLVSGESLVRNLQLGLEISKEFGETSFTGYLPDTFGHPADIPMILRQLEIDSAIVWRGVDFREPVFYWQSPSGDSVLTYHLTQGYFQNAFHMGQNDPEKRDTLQDWVTKVEGLADADTPILFPVGADHLGFAPDSPQWMKQLAPNAVTTTPDQFMAGLIRPEISPSNLLTGELRDSGSAYILPGVFSSRMYLKQWNRRLEWRLTRQLEQLLTWQAALGHQSIYEKELRFLWKTLLLNHPHDSICGCSVDSVHRENESRFEQIDQFSGAMVREAHYRLAQQLQAQDAMLWVNLSDSPYTGVLEILQDYSLAGSVPPPAEHAQVLSEETILDESFLVNPNILPLSENKALRRRSVVWASEVPAHGVKAVQQTEQAPDRVRVGERFMENRQMRVEVTAAGDLTITDWASKHVYSGMHQVWRNKEQGDSYNAASVPGEKPEQARLVDCQTLLEGPLRETLRLSYEFSSIGMPVEVVVSLDAGASRLDFSASFTNNTPDQKIQVLFQAESPIQEVVAEGHYAPVTRFYDPDYRIEAHIPAPRFKELVVQSGAIQRFIGFANQTLITEGLTEYEVEGNHLKLTLLRAFGMLSRDDTGVRGSHAGPPLATSEGQCLNRPMMFRYAWLPGFEVTTAFHQADWFYGAVYGFDRRQTSENPCDTQTWSLVMLDNPHVQSTAIIPEADGWTLRLVNPTGDTQPVSLSLPKEMNARIERVNLKGTLLEKLAAPTLTLRPYQIQTLRIRVQ